MFVIIFLLYAVIKTKAEIDSILTVIYGIWICLNVLVFTRAFTLSMKVNFIPVIGYHLCFIFLLQSVMTIK